MKVVFNNRDAGDRPRGLLCRAQLIHGAHVAFKYDSTVGHANVYRVRAIRKDQLEAPGEVLWAPFISGRETEVYWSLPAWIASRLQTDAAAAVDDCRHP